MAHRQLHMQLPIVVSNATTNFVSIPNMFAQNIRASFPEKTHGVVAFRLGWLSPPTSDSGGLARPSQSFVGWTNGISDGHYIQIPLGLAESLGIQHALDVAQSLSADSPLIISVAAVPYAPIAARVDVDPVTADDWDILQLHANFVEEELLSQICVLGPGQKFPMWVHGHTRINLQVTNIALVEQGQALCVRLARNTEVVVAPKLREKQDQYRNQSLRQTELESSKQTHSYQLRVQNVTTDADAIAKTEEQWNCTACVHPATLKRLQLAAGWPETQILTNGNVVYLEDRTRELIVVVSNVKRLKILEKLRKLRKSMKRQAPSSIGNQVYLKLRAETSVAPGHIVLPRAAQIRCKVHTLEKVILSLPRFEPIRAPTEFPPLSVHLTPIMGHDEVNSREVVLDSQFAIDALAVLQRWQKRMQTHGGGVPISDGCILAFDLSGKTTDNNARKKLTHFLVRIQDDETKKSDQQPQNPEETSKRSSKPATSSVLEPVYWLLSSDSKVEWQMDKSIVDLSLQKIYGQTNGNSEEINSIHSSSTGNKVKSLLSQGLSFYNADYYAHDKLEELGATNEVAEEIMDRVEPVLNSKAAKVRLTLGAPHPGGVYLCGGRGSGKTTLARAIARELRCNTDSLTHTVWISCANLRGGKRSEIEGTIGSAFKEALANAPSLLVFDDLDLLLPAPVGGGDGGGGGGEDAQLVWLAEWIEDLIHQYQSKLENFEQTERKGKTPLEDRNVLHRSISWMATGREKGSIRPSLIRTGLFDRIVEIQPLTARNRTVVLEALIRNKGIEHSHELDLDDIAGKAEGYAPADLDVLTERAMHCALGRLVTQKQDSDDLNDEDIALSQEDYEAALDGYTPAALRGVALAKSDVKWSDVGGLFSVRKTLKETLELPIQFAPLYERSPQRLASGVLLYGPPGCGKTLLAGAVAKECGLNFISVKGPEVLNKYIGASEQAVRDLFARGAAAAPCIVFFDEFDAVAPKRGNDSSGVTDRVVNQLLTFLDGVETRSGVYVMAATSRPDLVDPALLRPGRLDKQLLCGFPGPEDRADILKTIAKKMNLSPKAVGELDQIARLPEADLFTGADLQALLYSAQLDTVHSQIPVVNHDADDVDETDKKATKEQIEAAQQVQIEPHHLRKVLREARPSVSREERQRYNKIYEAFHGGRSADFNPVSGFGDDGKQRTALK